MLYLNAVQLMRDIVNALTDALVEEGVHLQPKEAHVMARLFIEDRQRPTDLAAAIGEPPTSFTPVLDRVQALGYIRRQPDEKDRRAVRVVLTEEGRKVARKCHVVIRAVDMKIKPDVRAWAGMYAGNGAVAQ